VDKKRNQPALDCSKKETHSSTSALACQEFASLERWLYSEERHLVGLSGIEVGEELRGRELLRLLLQTHIEYRGDGDAGQAIQVLQRETGKETLYTHKRTHTRRVVTIFGKVKVRRVGYGQNGILSIHPLDEQLQLPARIYSYEMQRRLVKKSVQGPFDEAIDALFESTGARIPKRSAEEIIADVSIDFDDFYVQRQGNVELKGGPLLIGSIDCKGIPMVKPEKVLKKARMGKGEKKQKKKMATVATVFTQQPYFRTPEDVIKSLFDSKKEVSKSKKKASKPEGKRVWASLEAGKDLFINDVNDEMNRRDPRGEKLRVVVTDGERALQHRVCRTMKNVVLVLDFFHALEKLWAAGNIWCGEGSAEAEYFVRKRALKILQGEVSQVVKGLRLIVTKNRLKGSKKEKMHEAARYYYRNRSRMRYDEYLEKGFPIGSGSVEGACKNLIKDRMERSGMRWTIKTAEAMVKMRAAYLSGDFDEYWDYHIAQDQKRLHSKNSWKPQKASS
jgi:hypothetical protein